MKSLTRTSILVASTAAALALSACAPVAETPAQTETPAAAPSYAPDGGLAVGDWSVRVVEIDRDATAEIAELDEYNGDPTPGTHYATVGLELTYLGEGDVPSSVHSDLAFFAAVDGELVTNYLASGCTNFPNELRWLADVYPGGKLVGNVCLEVPDSATDTFTVVADVTHTDGATGVELEIPASPIAVNPNGLSVPVPGPVGSRGNPHPFGTAVDFDGARISLVAADYDRDVEIDEYVTGTMDAVEGRQEIAFLVSVENTGSGDLLVGGEFFFRAVSDYGVGYGDGPFNCRPGPDHQLNYLTIPAGETAQSWVCFDVQPEEIESLVFYVEPFGTEAEDQVYFATP